MLQHAAKWGLALALAWQAGTAMAAVSGLKYISTTGDYIGGGQSDTLKAPRAQVSVVGDAGHATVSVSDAQNWWTLNFAAPSGQALATGSYPAAARYPFQSPMAPGLDMSGNGRGCNQLKGWYQVHEYVVGSDGLVKRLAIDFVQNCEITMPPLYGAVRYNSSVALEVPQMKAVAGADFGVLAGERAVLDGTQSFTRRKGKLVYRWTQLDGPAVTLDDAASPAPVFTAPAVPTAGATLHFRLDVSDRSGASSSDDVVVAVQSTSAPRTEVSFHGDAGDYITGGRSYRFTPADAALSFVPNYAAGIGVGVNGSSWWTLDFAPGTGAPLAVGSYTGAQRFPFQEAGHPGLSLSGDGRGCNTLTGQYTVHQLKLDSGGNPLVLDISFEQHCEGGTPAAYGQVLLNAVPHDTLAKTLRNARQRYGARR